MRARSTLALALSLLLIGATGRAEPSAAPRLFDAPEPPLTIDLEADWNAVQRDRSEASPVARPAKLSYAGPDGPVALDLKIETRGHSRLRKDVCEFPPLRLDFAKGSRKGTLFAGIGELKLVTYCQRDPSYQQNVLLEYLVYRSYQLLTDASYRVRLLNVRYHDPGAAKPRIERIGFVVEDTANLAERLGAERIKERAIDPAQLDPAAAARVEMFFYLVGMTDFSMTALSAEQQGPCCHNVRGLRMPSGTIVPVPYDFDQTGVVDPEYAMPDPRLGIKHVTQRKFRGVCRPGGLHLAAIQELEGKRDAMRALFEGFAALKSGPRHRALDFLDDFFAWAQDRARVEKTLAAECRSIAS
jgi:hypothetical protein